MVVDSGEKNPAMVITISRQAESGGEEIVDLVAERTGLRVVDRSIVEHMAQQWGLPVAHVARFDEIALGTVEALIAEWQTSVSREQYLRRLAMVLLALEREGDVIIMGRGAAFVLTDPGTLHVRIIAPMSCRVERLCARQGVSRLTAERLLRRSDEQRRRFVRQSFDGDIESPAHYDITINTAELPFGAAADLIALGARRKSRQRAIHAAGEEVAAQLLSLGPHPRLPRLTTVVWEQRWRTSRQPER